MIDVIITNPLRVSTVCAGTGTGKSPAVVTVALLSKVPTCIVTQSKSLQDQYLRDFQSIGMVDIRGRNNYPCDLKPDMTCQEGYAARCPYKGTVGCPSSQAEMRAATSSLVVTNYDKWIASRKYGQGMAHFQQVIFDEGDCAPDALARAMQVVISCREVEVDLEIDLPEVGVDEFSVWKMWAQNARQVAAEATKLAYERIAGLSDPKSSWVRHYTHMRNLARKLATLATANVNNWIVETIKLDKGGEGFQFDPIYPGMYAESALLLRVPKIIFVSATIRPKTMFMVGLGKDTFKFREFDSEFDPARSPFYYAPTQRVDSNHPDMSLLWLKLDQVAARRRDRKGIVHTISYARRDELAGRSRFADSMIINPKGEAPAHMLERYRAAGPGSILVSPSIGRGESFEGDEGRWQFILRIPYEPPSKIVKAREARDKEYRPYRAMQGLVQMPGRIIRSNKDWGENFIGDANLDWFLPRYGHLAPKSFFRTFKPIKTLPPPMNL